MMDICVIDHYMDLTSLDNFKRQIDVCNKFISSGQDFTEQRGHGTAVLSILFQVAPNVRVILFPVTSSTTLSEFLVILDYICTQNISNIINISCGYYFLGNNQERLNQILNRFKVKDVKIVAAYGRDNIKSFPACCNNVIGIQSKYSGEIINTRNLTYIAYPFCNKDIFFNSLRLRAKWNNNKNVLLTGNSFYAPIVSGCISLLSEPEMEDNISIINSVVKHIQSMVTKGDPLFDFE